MDISIWLNHQIIQIAFFSKTLKICMYLCKYWFQSYTWMELSNEMFFAFFIPTTLTSISKTSKPYLFLVWIAIAVVCCGRMFIPQSDLEMGQVQQWVKKLFSYKDFFHIFPSKIGILIIVKLQICTLWQVSSKCQQWLPRSLNILFFVQTVIYCQNLSTARFSVKDLEF